MVPAMANPRAKGEYEPNRTIRMGERWDLLGEVYGSRNRASLFDQFAAWMLHEPGAKLPKRVRPSSD